MNDTAVVGDVRFDYPPHYHRRHFATSSHAVTGVHGARVHGVVVASYPLKRTRSLADRASLFRPDGVFFELYQAPRRGHHLGATKTLPLILFDFPAIRAFTEHAEHGTGSVRTSAWTATTTKRSCGSGSDAPKSALLTVDDIIDSIAARSALAACGCVRESGLVRLHVDVGDALGVEPLERGLPARRTHPCPQRLVAEQPQDGVGDGVRAARAARAVR